MSNVGSNIAINQDSYSQIIFLVNNKSKEILFSSQPLELFFGSTIDLNQILPFFNNTAGNDFENLSGEWQTCLQLKEKETRNLSYVSTTVNGNSFLFDWEVHGISLPAVSDAPILLFSVKKAYIKEDARLVIKSTHNYQKDYAGFIELAVHELDAPLRKLSVLIDRMMKKIEPPNDIQDHINRIQNCLSGMRSMIDGLSALSELNADTIQNVSCNLGNIVLEVLEELQPQVQEKKMAVITSSLPTVHGDSMQYKQLFKNLIENAIRFSKKETLPTTEIRSEVLIAEEKNRFNLQDDVIYYKITC